MRRVVRLALLMIPLLALVAVLPLGVRAESRRKTEIRRVVVIHLDTTRVDDLSCYGGISRTPNIDAVAARGMRYTNSIAPVPNVSPSIASFMTGRHANHHGVYDVGGGLQQAFTTLGEILGGHGYVTAGFTSNLIVDRLSADPGRSLGFDQGFDVYRGISKRFDNPGGLEANAVEHVFCDTTVGTALEFVDEHRFDRFFLWMLHVDPHAPYAPPPPYDTMYLDHPELTSASVRLDPDAVNRNAYVSAWSHSHEYIARHKGEVTLTDHWIGVLLDRLDDLPGRTLLIITADHGESLGDAGKWFGHGDTIRHTCVNVPLVVACDGVVPIGVSDALVANVDLAPTILDLLDLPAEGLGADGRSLAATFGESDPWPQRLVPIQALDGSRWRGVRSGRFCLQSRFDPDSGTREQTLLYDVAADPKESTDVSQRYPDELRAHLRFEQEWFGQGQLVVPDLRDDPEMIRRLRSLGYLR